MSTEKIIVRGVNWLGDAVMTTPALLRLREAKPRSSITILTHEKLADLWHNQPFIDDVLIFTSEETVFQIGRRVRRGQFDVGLIFPNSPRSALELWYGKVPNRIGYARSWRNLLLTKAIAPREHDARMQKRSLREIKRLIASNASPSVYPSASHHIHHYLHLVSAAFGSHPGAIEPQLTVLDGDMVAAKGKFCITGDVICGLNPGAEYGPAKRWPKERFIEVAVSVHQQTKAQWIVFGGKSDVALCEEIATGIRQGTGWEDAAISVAGRTSLRELCALMKQCRVVLTNDTGPMHVAGAVGARVVAPFGSTSVELTAPGLPGAATHKFIRANVPCSPCFLRECPIDFRCMNGISVQQVTEAVVEILAE